MTNDPKGDVVSVTWPRFLTAKSCYDGNLTYNKLLDDGDDDDETFNMPTNLFGV